MKTNIDLAASNPANADAASGAALPVPGDDRTSTRESRLTSEQVWHTLDRTSFAVVSYVTPAGDPRSSGIVYKTVGRRLYLAVAADSWKARHIQASGQVAMTVPVRRGGILALIFPIPPATISFPARAIVHPPGEVDVGTLSPELESLLPPERRATGCIIELLPEGTFLTYGLGVSLAAMRHPAAALAHVPVIQSVSMSNGGRK